MVGDSRGRRVALGFAIGIPISALFLFLAARGTEREAFSEAISSARPLPLLLALGALALMYLLQAVRWRIITGEARLGLGLFVEMVLGGVAVNNVLPGRIGDILRARWLSTEAGMPWGRALATVVFDRAGDVVALALLLGVSVWGIDEAPWLRRIAAGTFAAVAIILLVVAFARLYAGRRQRERRHRGRLRTFVRDTVDGLARPLGPRLVGSALVLSVAAWGAFSVAVIAVASAVGFELDPLDALFVASVVNLGVAIPSSPGFVGTYQWLAVESLSRLDVATREEALAFSVLLHAAWYLPTTLVGGFFVLTRLRLGERPVEPAATGDR